MKHRAPESGSSGRRRSAVPPDAALTVTPTAAPRGRRRRARNLTAVFSAVLVAGMVAQLHVLTASGAATASASIVSGQPFVAGETLSGVVGKGGLSATNAFGAWRGKAVQVVTNYLATDSWSAMTNVTGEDLTGYFNGSNVHRVWSVPMLPTDGEGNMAGEAAGDYNGYFQTIARDLVAGGDGNSTIRLGWEMTGNWYPWSGINNPGQFAQAWREIVTAMRQVSPNFTFDFNIAMFNSDPTPMYPGDAYVDIMGADNYDDSYAWQYPASDHTAVWNYILTGPYGLNWLANFASQHHKRMSFPEWGVSKRCDQYSGGDDPYFIQQMYNFIRSHDVAYETYSEFAESSCRNFVLTSGPFPNAAYAYQQEMKTPITYGGGSPVITPPTTTPPTTTPPTSKPPTTTPPTSKPPTSAPPTNNPPITTSSMSIDEVRATALSSRASSWALQGSTLQGNRYIYLNAPSGTVEVRFYLDRTTSSTPTQTEDWSPWDFAGGSNTAANAWNASGVSKGLHKLIVLATLSNGTVDSATVTFNTD